MGAQRATPEAWREWWQNPDVAHFYFMGKDNIVFHAVIWPTMLMGYGDGELADGCISRQRRLERVPDDEGSKAARAAVLRSG